jgi:aspergillopepsin I
VPDGSVAVRKAYAKFGLQGFGFIPELDIATNLVPVSELAASSSNGSGNGQVSTTSSQNDAEFLSPVTVGGQTLVMNFDTGSSDMYVILPASNLRIL